MIFSLEGQTMKTITRRIYYNKCWEKSDS